MVLSPLQGTPLSALRYRCIQLALHSVLTFGDPSVHSSKTSFLKAICSACSLLHGFHAEVGDKLFKTLPLFAVFF